MPDIIHLLPDAIANQIAAGEVVQRPSSALKEMMENSIDAGSTDIQVIVKEAGKVLIQVIDNGKGMSVTDARMCFERHATSKIRVAEDLFSLTTMGFRGEAMASIAAVAQVEMKTRRPEDELGQLLVVEGSEIKKQEQVACPVGTSIAVKNLFYNIPARRNFLKSNPVEMRHIIDEFQRVALAHPEIAFSLWQNDLEIYQLPEGKLSQRIVNLFGKNYREQLASCQEATDQVKITGYVGKPAYAKKTRGEQFFFVNKRFIKNNYLHHAVQNAFEGLLPSDSYPFYVLFIEIDPKHIDVNVHPTKTEIKFDDERTLYAVIRAAVRQALGTHQIAPPIDFSMDVNFASTHVRPSAPPAQFREEKNYGSFRSIPSSDFQIPSGWEKADPSLSASFADKLRALDQDSEEESYTLPSMVNALEVGKEEEAMRVSEPETFQVHQRYIASQVKSGLLLMDQQAAHERILYEKYLDQLAQKKGASQHSLFPQTLTLNPADFALLFELLDEIQALGFSISEFGKNTIAINGHPSEVEAGHEKALLEGLIEQFKKNKSELSLDTHENMARAMAKRASIKPGQVLSKMEMKNLVERLFACKNPGYAPNGQKTFTILDFDKLATLFR
ncbi:DNA mismatch repair endonuclease MutL [Cytophagales bacterium LB-30]|uniref:DNA mismatch repair protein MutL n=1 Tax=Shiella aurantiaca TaxID=3058365 RepID=A0ABT8F2P1_9BACT|nr:DNA mismatch repair endonuclease MutL [Shiella aurantiaca]MDN4164716.1 DNA mismatch repair endonuclease MutL [Shiella aurantiaca]